METTTEMNETQKGFGVGLEFNDGKCFHWELIENSLEKSTIPMEKAIEIREMLYREVKPAFAFIGNGEAIEKMYQSYEAL